MEQLSCESQQVSSNAKNVPRILLGRWDGSEGDVVSPRKIKIMYFLQIQTKM